jgi:hypothetical protein
MGRQDRDNQGSEQYAVGISMPLSEKLKAKHIVQEHSVLGLEVS